MSSEVPNQAEKTNPDKPVEIDPKILDRIKHPPAIDDVMRDLPPDELMGNPAIMPEMLNEGDGLRDDLKRD